MKIPVAVNMRSTKGKAVMEQGWVNDGAIRGVLHQFVQVAEMALAASDTVASTIFI